MPLEIGSKLGQYEILSSLGAGGMGEVYRAKDTKLGREVAIKVLLEHVSADDDRLARFDREARVLASLSHPHIGGIYGLEEVDGQKALVLELIEGPTLADRVSQGPVPVDEALAIARQIAEALAAAHGQGIIHRDLKPANVKLQSDGMVKVLDFGLAKIQETVGAGDPDLSPTLTAAATQMGVIMGTAAYMSPEQARGRPVDKRADVWALGVVLFEMLTGRRPFEGEDVSMTLSSLLQQEPDWELLPPTLSPAVAVFLRRCLEKDPRDRVHDVGDLRLALGGAFDALAAAPEESSSRPSPARIAALSAVVFALGFLVAVLTGFPSSAPTGVPRPETQPVRRFAIDLGPTATLIDWDIHAEMALSPDGTMLAYVARGEDDPVSKLYLRRLGELEPVAIPESDYALSPFFSPDGEWIGFYTTNWTPGGPNQITKVSIDDLRPQKVTDAWPPGGATWLDDGSIVFSGVRPHRSHWDEAKLPEMGLFRVDSRGGEAVRLTSLDPGSDERLHYRPSALPGGEVVLFTLRRGVAGDGGSFQFDIAALDLATGTYRVVLDDASDAQYVASSGHLIFVRDTSLWAIPFDAETLVTSGAEVPISSDIQWSDRHQSNAPYAVSAEGSLVILPAAPPTIESEYRMLWVDPAGGREALSVPPMPGVNNLRVSPDGRLVAFRSTAEGSQDIWVHERARPGSRIRLTFADTKDAGPTWGPDSSDIVYAADDIGEGRPMWTTLHRRRADGAGDVVDLPSPEGRRYPEEVRPNGALLYSENNPETGWDVAISTPEGGSRALVQTPFDEAMPALSPDGRWLAYHSGESGTNQIYVRPFPDVDAGKWQVSIDGGAYPVWAPDGSRIYYPRGEAIVSTPVSTDPSFSVVGETEVLFEGDFASPIVGRHWDLEYPDGKRFLMLEEVPVETPSTQLIFIENWVSEVERASKP